MKTRTLIRVGQRVIRWDGQRGYIDLNTKGTRVYGPGEAFKVLWLDADGRVEDAEYLTLAQFDDEGIRFGRGVMPWAK